MFDSTKTGFGNWSAFGLRRPVVAATCAAILVSFVTVPAQAQLSPAVSKNIRTIGGYFLPTLRNNRNGLRNGLPPVSMDSFVTEAKEHAEHIYGDEGIDGPPPYECFQELHRINTGILDRRDAGLTTGHASYLPDAAGRDEFLAPQEWSMSGPQGVSWRDGFYKGVPFKLPGATYVASQFPGGYNTLNWLYMQDEVRPRNEPLPVSWNNGSLLNPVPGGFWSPLANGNWVNQYGDVIEPDGTITYGPGSTMYKPGTIRLRTGDIIPP